MNVREALAYGVPCDDARQTEAIRLADEVKQIKAECDRLQMENAELSTEIEDLTAAVQKLCRPATTPNEDA